MAVKCPKCNFDNPEDTLYCGKCAAPLKPSEEISVSPTETLETPKEELTMGSVFAGRYQIIEVLGKGGMGKVYKAHDTEIKEKVALKLINPEISADKRTIERFQNELKFARKISHRNVCRMYDLNKEEGSYYITMEYVPGQDLKGLIKQSGQLAIGTTISVAKQVCEGLAEAHRLGVVHRDLKPSNIMIDKEGNARIMDFGIARSLKAKGITGTGVMIGTPEYMSPEQVEGKEVDQHSDIYSLGIILYEMLTGKVPFEGETPFGIAFKHKSETPKDPKELNAQIPEDLSYVIMKCMEKDRERRFQGGEELLSKLIRIEKDLSTTDKVLRKKKPKTEKVGGIKWEKSILYGGVAILSILLLMSGIYLFIGHWREIDSIAVLPIKNLSGDPKQESFADSMTEALIDELTKSEALRHVIPSTSVMQYKAVPKRLEEIGRELEVYAVLEGSVLFIEQRVQITVKLIEARKERLLWSKSYERDVRNILDFPNELANAIAYEIIIKLTDPELEKHWDNDLWELLDELLPWLKSHKANPELAYHLYNKGRYFLKWRRGEDLSRAWEYFYWAIEIDPNCAPAYAGLADYNVELEYYYDRGKKEDLVRNREEAKEYAQKAVEIDNLKVETRASLARVKMIYDWDWEGAERRFKQETKALKSDYEEVYLWYAHYLMYMARFDEAIIEMRQALELNPFSRIINCELGQLFYYARQYDQAIEALQKTIEMDTNFKWPHLYLGRVYLQKSMYKEALAEFQKTKIYSHLWGGSFLETWIGIAYAKMGKKGKAQEVLDKLMKRLKFVYIPPYRLAVINFALGENDLGFRLLDKAYEERDPRLCLLKIDPILDSVRSDQRFKALLKKVGLED